MTAAGLLSALAAAGPTASADPVTTSGADPVTTSGAGPVAEPVPRFGTEPVPLPAPGAMYKAAFDTLPTPRLTPDLQKRTAEKEAAAASWYRRAHNRSARSGYVLSGGKHQSQETSYWCGPATLVITQSAKDEVSGRSQEYAADLLETDSSGTSWYGVDIDVPDPTGYPMVDALNWRLPGANYVPRSLPYSPDGDDMEAFAEHVVHDTDNDYAIAGNVWEVPGGPHLVGHPNIEIFHWVSIDGYNSETGGGQVHYLDPVGGVSTSMISWADGVPKSARISADTLTTVMGGRGYVW
ncbi:hypothetical protein ACWGI8_18600 [Streptomyces sp. NPDC054841]